MKNLVKILDGSRNLVSGVIGLAGDGVSAVGEGVNFGFQVVACVPAAVGTIACLTVSTVGKVAGGGIGFLGQGLSGLSWLVGTEENAKKEAKEEAKA